MASLIKEEDMVFEIVSLLVKTKEQIKFYEAKLSNNKRSPVLIKLSKKECRDFIKAYETELVILKLALACLEHVSDPIKGTIVNIEV